jgi:hypothetical protein
LEGKTGKDVKREGKKGIECKMIRRKTGRKFNLVLIKPGWSYPTWLKNAMLK